MKNLNLVLVLCNLALAIALPKVTNAQVTIGIYDTLLIENFEHDFDVEIKAPSGNDQTWILYDADGFPEKCVQQEDTYGFYASFDWGKDMNNAVLTSCSFTPENGGNCGSRKNENWLILPPQFIAAENVELGWKSAPFIGPMWMDGYKVLVSRTNNLPESFTDTLFIAASTLNSPEPPLPTPAGLNPSNYTFSEGYIHANSFQDANYYQLRSIQGLNVYQGFLEPHTIDLSNYADELIYIAFLHDSYCNFAIQLDDIYLRKASPSNTHRQYSAIQSAHVFPNPITERAFLEVSLREKAALQVRIMDNKGRHIKSIEIGQKPSGKYRIEVDCMDLVNGMYYAIIQTNHAVHSEKFFVQR